jgi:hypothetical protein
MTVALATPIQSTQSYVTCRALRQVVPLNDATPVVWLLTYSACDALGNPTGDPAEVTLLPADKVAYATALPQGARQAMLAALISNQPQFAGVIS